MQIMSVYLQRVFENGSAVIEEYGLKVSEIKSNVVYIYIYGVRGNRRCKIGGTYNSGTE